jgi:hypothetical protein
MLATGRFRQVGSLSPPLAFCAAAAWAKAFCDACVAAWARGEASAASAARACSARSADAARSRASGLMLTTAEGRCTGAAAAGDACVVAGRSTGGVAEEATRP